jgi:hypothetical protein
LNPVLSDYDEQSGITRAGQAAEAARNSAFQGSRYGIQEGQTEGQLARGRASTEGDLLGRMFTESTALSGQDAARRQQAMTSNQGANLQAGIANQGIATALAQANAQANLDRARQLAGMSEGTSESERLNAKFAIDAANQEAEARNNARSYDIDFLKETGGLLPQLDPYIGRTTNMSDTSMGTSSKKNQAGLGDWFGDALTAYAGSKGKAA